MHRALRLFIAVCAVLSLLSLASSRAGSFSADFDSGAAPAGTTLLGNAAVTATGGVGDSGVLRLTEAISSQTGSWVIDDFSGGTAVAAFTADFKVQLGGGTVTPADGFSFNWTTDLSGSAFGEEGSGTGLTVAFDTFDNGGSEAPAIDIKWNGGVIAHSAVPFNFSAANAAFVAVQGSVVGGTRHGFLQWFGGAFRNHGSRIRALDRSEVRFWRAHRRFHRAPLRG